MNDLKETLDFVQVERLFGRRTNFCPISPFGFVISRSFYSSHLVTIMFSNLKNRSINDYPNESSFFSGSEFSTLLAKSVSRPKLKFINAYDP